MGHHEIEHHGIVIEAEQKLLCPGAVGCQIHGMTIAGQRLTQVATQVWRVLNHQQAHHIFSVDAKKGLANLPLSVENGAGTAVGTRRPGWATT